MTTPGPRHDEASAVAVAVGFARTVRASGVPVGAAQLQTFVAALAAVDPNRRRDVYWAGRVTLCSHVDDLAPYDRAFEAYFPHVAMRTSASPVERRTRPARLRTDVALPGDDDPGRRTTVNATRASAVDVLRRADLARLSPAERAEAHRLINALANPADRRRTRRRTPAGRGAVDRAATVRALVRGQGELDRLRFRRHRLRPRRLVLLVDISGSMEPYAQAMLRFAHAARHRGGPTEVFCLGTRLTRLTGALAFRDPDRAMAAVAARVADWSGGTRLGAGLQAFLAEFGQPGMARGAVVVLCSDGWEREDPSALGAGMERLQRLAHRVVWVNPLKARPGYAPLARGMATALPYVDDFVEGHSVEALEHLAQVIVGASRHPRAPRRASGMRHWEDEHA